MWVSILQLFEEQTWTLGFCNIKIVGSGVTCLESTEFKMWNALSVMVHTNLSTTDNLLSIVKQTKKLILQD